MHFGCHKCNVTKFRVYYFSHDVYFKLGHVPSRSTLGLSMLAPQSNDKNMLNGCYVGYKYLP